MTAQERLSSLERLTKNQTLVLDFDDIENDEHDCVALVIRDDGSELRIFCDEILSDLSAGQFSQDELFAEGLKPTRPVKRWVAATFGDIVSRTADGKETLFQKPLEGRMTEIIQYMDGSGTARISNESLRMPIR